MTTYTVLHCVDAVHYEDVEADSPEQAMERAESTPSICHQCSDELELGDDQRLIVLQDHEEVANKDLTGLEGELKKAKKRIAELESENLELERHVAELEHLVRDAVDYAEVCPWCSVCCYRGRYHESNCKAVAVLKGSDGAAWAKLAAALKGTK